jgi:hypothetical protein
MSKLHLPRHIGSIDYASGQRKTMELDQDGVLMQTNIRVRFTVTNGGSAAVGALFQTLARIINRIEFIMGSKDTVISISGAMAAARARYEWGVKPDGMEDTVVLTGAAATAYDITIPICHFLPRSRRPDDCALDLRRVSQATIAITWAASDCSDFYTTPNSAAISAVTCDIEGHYHTDVPNDRVYMVREMRDIEDVLTATNTKHAITIDGKTGLNLRSLAVASLDAKVGENDIVNRLTLKSGTKTFQDRYGAAVRAHNKPEFGLETLEDGFYYMNLTSFGETVQSIATGPNDVTSDVDLEVDGTKGTGTTNLMVSVEGVRHLSV